ncbi:MAG TPA: DUF4124 domain-containing protein [Usitatibacter sp.]|nr:DUF4124 domain-containing protein [Usitatibacter sp.]
MTRTLILALALALGASAALAQLYKYTDPKTGKTVYTDQPPVGQDAKTVRIKGGNGPATQSAVAQDKALDKGRKKVADDAKKAGDAAERAAKAEANCNAAKQNFQIYADGGRIQKLNAQGEREYMTDEEIEAKRVSSRREMEEACKQP